MHRRIRTLALSGVTFAALLGWASRPAQACGGFFCSAQQPVNQAAERIELPQGSVLRGNSQTLGMWPSATAQLPANLRVRTLSTSGEGRLVEDNADAIDAQLVAYNADFKAPAPRASGPGASMPEPMAGGSGGFCALVPGRPGRGALPGFALGVLAALAVARRHRRRIEGGGR